MGETPAGCLHSGVPLSAPGIQAPSLLEWATHSGGLPPQSEMSGLLEWPMHRGGPPPWSETDLGMTTVHELPPPPRSAPAASRTPGSTSFLEGGGGSRAQHRLNVRTGDHQYETVNFSDGDSLSQVASMFLTQRGLKLTFQAGLTEKMRSMVALGQASESVDIVDLI